MARRRFSTPREPKPIPPNLRNASVFVSEVWAPSLRAGALTLRKAVSFPVDPLCAALPEPSAHTNESNSMIVGRFLDRTFGVPAGFDRAKILWDATDAINALPLPDLAELRSARHSEFGNMVPHVRLHTFRIPASHEREKPAVLFSGRVQTMYPTSYTHCEFNSTSPVSTLVEYNMPAEDVRSAFATERYSKCPKTAHAIEQIRDWSLESVRVYNDALGATGFIEWAAASSGSTKAMFDNFPGMFDAFKRFSAAGMRLRDLCHTEGKDAGYPFLPTRGADWFNTRAMSASLPGWSSQWAKTRAILISMIMVLENESDDLTAPIGDLVTTIHKPY